VRALLFVVFVGSVAYADPRPMTPDAQEHFDRGRELYKQHDYSAAMAEFVRGRDLDPHPDFDFVLGQAYMKLADCKHATRAYNAFLAAQPTGKEASLAHKAVSYCEKIEAEPAAEAEHTPEQPPNVDVPPVAEPAVEPPTPPRARVHTHVHQTTDVVTSTNRWSTDVAGGVLAGAGVIGLAGGVTFLVLGEHDISGANGATTVARLQSDAANGERERTIGTISAVAGGAFAIAAVVRYALVARGHHVPDRRLSINVTPTGSFAVWSGRF
jgi:hypothetical protein